ncbi:VIT family protein [Ahrensia sp. R2A130]|uniref:VIT1/CCC1 transporter family protein n=1 Tax=Ahrensia sp. R2A130 TaxID=744979 RepID=UPI0001E0F099|nr:VIT family protein [Ahrensia sp. R2A130]EFL89896.1 nodulin 21 [Ahrensia sp. R2A130]
MDVISAHAEEHNVHKSSWLRAAVMGANDGIISTSSLMLGVAAASASSADILTAGVAGLTAGAMSMAAGEYVSVSSQADLEKADLDRERRELEINPETELQELAMMFEARGAAPETAMQVAIEMTAKDALAAHAREELGITEMTEAQPLQAAVVSACTFAAGAFLPLLMAWLMPREDVYWSVAGITILVLAVLGALGAKAGGANLVKGAGRVTFWGIAAMAVTSAIGLLFGAVV